jgi:hypothetical protein
MEGSGRRRRRGRGRLGLNEFSSSLVFLAGGGGVVFMVTGWRRGVAANLEPGRFDLVI